MKNSNSKGSVVCFGEVLIDMISSNTGSLVDSKGFLKKFGGAPANTAMGLAKLKIPVSFIGKVGTDPFGQFLKNTLDSYNVNTLNLIMSPDVKTTLAFVSLTESGDRDFFFFRGAHEAIDDSEVHLPKDARILHFGSLSQTNENGKQATGKLIEQAKKNNVLISYDPNLRTSLWDDVDEARKIMLATAKKVNVFKVSEEEVYFLSGTYDLEEASKKLFTSNLDAFFVTLGKRGCYYKTKKFSGMIPTIEVNVVDTTGAGDAFNAGYIHMLYNLKKPFSEMTEEEVVTGLRKANVIASLTTTKKGAITAFPKMKDIKLHIK